MNIKKTITSVTEHIKKHPIPYTIAATTVVAVGATIYLEKKLFDGAQLVNLTSNAARMRDTGKGLYFDLKDGSGTVAMILEELLDKPLDRLN